MAIVKDIQNALERLAPSAWAESYDNVGLLVGNPQQEVSGILVSLDCTEEVVQEAINQKLNTIVCHHPIVFSGLKKITGSNYVERAVILAIKNDINILAYHTNLDNVQDGVCAKMAEKIGLQRCKVLVPKVGLLAKAFVYVPQLYVSEAQAALFAAGAGKIGNYEECSFSTHGEGSFKPNEIANPKVGEAGGPREIVNEVKLEVIYFKHLENNIIKAIHSLTFYEEVAFELIDTRNPISSVGSGLIGKLPKPLPTQEFLALVKAAFNCGVVRYTNTNKEKIESVALCGGSGSFLLKNAMAAGADAYISADFKYHEFFDAENRILIADIGHFESEQFTNEIFISYLREKFVNFAVQNSRVNTNPINYF
jgi:dinuclear metal center YbgI/SA1388 family protein